MNLLVACDLPLLLSYREKDIENFSGFVKKMDEGVRVMSTAVTDQYKRYSHRECASTLCFVVFPFPYCSACVVFLLIE